MLLGDLDEPCVEMGAVTTHHLEYIRQYLHEFGEYGFVYLDLEVGWREV